MFKFLRPNAKFQEYLLLPSQDGAILGLERGLI
jgi:hypothetical protein